MVSRRLMAETRQTGAVNATLLVSLVILVAVSVYLNTLPAGFAYDDKRAVLSNPDVLPSEPLWRLFTNDFWGTPLRHAGSHKSYRPLCVLSFRLNYLLAGGLEPYGYHLTNVLLHAAVAALFAALAGRLFAWAALPSLLAGLLFALHPVHCEAVAGVVGRADVGACAFFLLALAAYIKYCDTRRQHDQHSLAERHQTAAFDERSDSRRRAADSSSEEAVGTDTDALHQESCGKRTTRLPASSGSSRYLYITVALAAASVITKEHGVTVLAVCVVYDVFIAQRCGLNDIATEIVSRTRAIGATLTSLWCFRFSQFRPHAARTANPAQLNTPRPELSPVEYRWHMQPANAERATARCRQSRRFGPRYRRTVSPPLYTVPTYSARNQIFSPTTLIIRHRPCLDGVATLAVTGAALVLLRAYAMGFSAPIFSSADNPVAAEPSSLTRMLTLLYLPVVNFQLLCYPKWLSYDWSMDSIPLIRTISDSRNVLTLLLYFMVAFVGSRLMRAVNARAANSTDRWLSASSAVHNEEGCGGYGGTSCAAANINNNNHQAYLNNNNHSEPAEGRSQHPCPCCELNARIDASVLGMAMLVLPYIPASNLFFYVGFVVAERVLYIPSMGYCLLIAVGADYMFSRISKAALIGNSGALRRRSARSLGQQRERLCRLLWRTACVIAVFVLLCGYLARTWRRNDDWLSEERLYAAGASVNSAKSLANLGTVLNQAGRKSDAERAYRAALDRRPNMADVHYNLGLLLHEQGRYDEALDSYRRATRYRPSLALAHLNIGLVLTIVGRRAEAAAVFEHTATLDGSRLKDPRLHDATRTQALYNLGKLHSDAGRLQLALRVFSRALATMPDVAARHPLVSSTPSSFSVSSPLSHQLDALSSSSHKDGMLTHRIDAYTTADTQRQTRSGRDDKSEVSPENFIDAVTQPETAAAAQLRRSERRHRYFEPQSLYNMIGETHARLGDAAAAENWFVAALRAKPDHVPTLLTYGRLCARSNRSQDADRLLRRAIELRPSDSAPYRHYGQFLADVGRHAQAADVLGRAARVAPLDFDVAFAHASALRQAGHHEAAERAYRRTVRLKPTDATGHANLAAMLHLNGKLDEALSAYHTALRLRPTDQRAIDNLQRLQRLLDKRAARKPVD